MRRLAALLLVTAGASASLHCLGEDANAPLSQDDGGIETPTDGSSSGNDGGSTDPGPGTDASKAACSETSPCTDQACVNGFCQGVCAPGKVRCSGNAVETCEASGQWGTPSGCVSSTCVNGKCTGSCSVGQSECSGNGLMGCDAGTWADPTDCTNKTCCGNANAKACQGDCAPGQTQCSGNAVQTCGACGAWNTPTPCTNQTCLGAFPTGQCTGECAPGQTRCYQNAAQTCTNGVFSGSACVNQTCVGSTCTGVCAPNQRSCASSTTPRHCGTDGQWVNEIACPATKACVNGSCVSL